MKDSQTQEEKDAEEAFEWLYRWTRKSQSSKLYAVLERCFNGLFAFKDPSD